MSAALTLAEPCDPGPSRAYAPGEAESVNSALEGQLRAALRGGCRVPYDRQIRADCFLFGALCAKAERQLPEWMNSAVLWAHEAALRGYLAFCRQRANTRPTDAAERPEGTGIEPLSPAVRLSATPRLNRRP